MSELLRLTATAAPGETWPLSPDVPINRLTYLRFPGRFLASIPEGQEKQESNKAVMINLLDFIARAFD